MGINIVLIALVFWAVGCLVLGWLLDTWQERRIDTRAEQVLFLDDNKINVDAARSIGIQAELFPRDAGVAALAPLLSGYRPATGIGAGVA